MGWGGTGRYGTRWVVVASRDRMGSALLFKNLRALEASERFPFFGLLRLCTRSLVTLNSERLFSTTFPFLEDLIVYTEYSCTWGSVDIPARSSVRRGTLRLSIVSSQVFNSSLNPLYGFPPHAPMPISNRHPPATSPRPRGIHFFTTWRSEHPTPLTPPGCSLAGDTSTGARNRLVNARS